MYQKDLFETHENEFEDMMDYLNFLDDMATNPWGDE